MANVSPPPHVGKNSQIISFFLTAYLGSWGSFASKNLVLQLCRYSCYVIRGVQFENKFPALFGGKILNCRRCPVIVVISTALGPQQWSDIFYTGQLTQNKAKRQDRWKLKMVSTFSTFCLWNCLCICICIWRKKTADLWNWLSEFIFLRISTSHLISYLVQFQLWYMELSGW